MIDTRIDPVDRINVLWFLPTHGDGHYLGTSTGGRAVDLPYLRQIAQAADMLGYYGVLIPTGKSCEDSWLVASALVPLTERLRFLVAFRPGLQPPSLAARMAATLDRLSNGRVLINIVTGGDPVENRGDGLFLDHDERYRITGEFLDVYRRLMGGQKVDYEGRHIRVEGAEILFPPVQEGGPPLWSDFADELRHLHLGAPWPEGRESVIARLRAAFERVAAEQREGAAVKATKGAAPLLRAPIRTAASASPAPDSARASSSNRPKSGDR